MEASEGVGAKRGWSELEALLRTLDKSSNRLDSLESIRNVVKANGCLPDAALRSRLIRAASSCASDPNSRIASKWLQLMADLATQFGDAMVAELEVVLPACIEAMNSSSASVRQAAVQTMCACGKVRDHDPRVLLRGFAACIQHSPSEEQRAECCAALVTIYSTAKYRTTGAEALVLQEVVTPALVQAMADASRVVAVSAAQAFEAVRARSPEALQAAVDQLSADLQKKKIQTQAAVDQLSSDLQKVLKAKMSAGHAVSNEDAYREEDDTSHRCEEDTGSRDDGERGGSGTSGVSLSFVPLRLMAELQDANNWRVRALAVEELQMLVQAVREPAEMRPHLAQLMDFLTTLLHDPNFKIEITALQTIGDVISLMRTDILPYAPLLMPELLQKLGDNKTLVRQANAKVLVKIMDVLGPDNTVHKLLSDLVHANWRVREEIVVLTMQAVLTFEGKLNHEKLVAAISPLLDDEKTKVKLTAVELLALLHASLGAERFHAHLPALDGTARRMLDARLAQPQLATLSAEGHLELPTLRGQALDDTAACEQVAGGGAGAGAGAGAGGAVTPRGSTRAGGDRGGNGSGGETSPIRHPDVPPSVLEGMRTATASPCRRMDRGAERLVPASPMRFQAGAQNTGGSQNLEDLALGLATLLDDDQPLYSELTVDDPRSGGGAGAGGVSGCMLRSPRRLASNGADGSGKATPRSGACTLDQVPENMEDSGRERQRMEETRGLSINNSQRGNANASKKPIKPFWMDGLRSDVGAGEPRDAGLRDWAAGSAAAGGAGFLGAGAAGAGGGGSSAVRELSRELSRAAPAPDSLRTDSFNRGSSLGAAGSRVFRASRTAAFESLPGITNSSPMICSPPMSPQSVRACVSPNSQMRLLHSLRDQAHITSAADRFGFHSEAAVPPLEKATSQDLRRPPASVPLRTAGTVGGLLGDDLSLSQDKIASRLSIIKTRRGRTSASRRGDSSMSAPAADSGGYGLGDTRPGSSLFSTNSLDDIRGLDTPESQASQAETRRGAREGGGGGGGGGYEPAQSAPAGMGRDKEKEKEKGGRERVQSERNMERNMEIEGAPPGAHRSVMEISAKPIELVSTEELQPSDNPEGCMKSLIQKLASTDWAIQMEALNNTRTLSIYHASATVLPQLHAVVRAVLAVVDNLRSNLSKSALMALSDMLTYLKTAMDPELDQIVVICVKKCADTAGFIADEAKRAMHTMIQHCSEPRTISALIHANANKNPLIRGKVAIFVCAIIDYMGSRLCNTREQERLFPLVVQYLSEGNAEPRAAGKRAIMELHEHNKASGEFDRLLRRCADADVRVVEKLLAQEQALNGANAFAVNASSSHGRMSALASTLPPSTSHGASGTLERDDSGKPPRGRRHATLMRDRSDSSAASGGGGGGVGGGERPFEGSSSSYSTPHSTASATRSLGTDLGADSDLAETKGRNISSLMSRKATRAAVASVDIVSNKAGSSGGGGGGNLSGGSGNLSGGGSANLSDRARQLKRSDPSDTLASSKWMEESGLDRLPTIQANIASTDFRYRYEAVQELTELLLKEHKTCAPKATFFIDLYVARLSDNNSKVAATALQGVDRLVGSYGPALEGSLGLLVPALAANLSNTSPQIRTLANAVIESLASSLDPAALVQPLSAAVDFGNQRAKAQLLDKMRGLVRKVAEKKPQLLNKFFLASAIKSLDEHKADVRSANALLIKELYSALGEGIFNCNPRLAERQLCKLKEVIASQTPSQPSLSGLTVGGF